MLRIAVSLAILVALACGAVMPSFAWDETGHKITAYIAWQRMTPEVREKVIKTILAAPEDSQIGAYYMSYGSRTAEARKREFFMLMATWADMIRDRTLDTRYKKYNNPTWHYFDTLWMVKDGKIEFLKGPPEGGK